MRCYYDQDGITIYHGDCRSWPRRAEASLLVTDPPYGVDFEGKRTKWTEPTGGYTTDDDPDIGPKVVGDWVVGDFNIEPLVERAVVFPGIRRLYNYPPARDIGCIYCPSGAGIGPWGFTLFHPVLFYGTRPGPLRPSSMMSFATSGPSEHPCPKPLSWLRWALELAAKADDVVVDPFMGSGTTLLAARELGLRAIGIEIEEKYCEIAVQRLAQGVLEFA